MKTKIENLQYQLSNGAWIDCADRTDEFFARCVEYGGVKSEQEAIDILKSGKTLRNDSMDWYSKCRIKPQSVEKIQIEMVKCDCGHQVPIGTRMMASIGTSCPDCYDRMSM